MDGEGGPESGALATKPPPSGVVRDLLDLVNADLRGRITMGDRERLTADPQRWLGVLGSVLHNIRTQIDDRGRVLEAELSRPERSAAWEDIRREHNDWLRRARHFERLVRVRIHEVRQLIPSDDLHALISEALAIESTDVQAFGEWQRRAQRALLGRG